MFMPCRVRNRRNHSTRREHEVGEEDDRVVDEERLDGVAQANRAAGVPACEHVRIGVPVRPLPNWLASPTPPSASANPNEHLVGPDDDAPIAKSTPTTAAASIPTSRAEPRALEPKVGRRSPRSGADADEPLLAEVQDPDPLGQHLAGGREHDDRRRGRSPTDEAEEGVLDEREDHAPRLGTTCPSPATDEPVLGATSPTCDAERTARRWRG